VKKAVKIAIVSLLLLEVVSCAYYRKGVPKEQRAAVDALLGRGGSDGHSAARYRAHPYFNYTGNPAFRFKNGDSAHDSRGFRAQASFGTIPGAKRLVAIGASTTYGMYFGKAQNVWPSLVAAALRQAGISAEATTLALPAYTTFELIGVAAMLVPSLKPDLVLIHTGVNDAFAVGFEDEGGPDQSSFRHAWSFVPPSPLLLALMRLSALVRVLAMRTLPDLVDMIRSIQYPAPSHALLSRHIAAASGKYYRRNLTTLAAVVRSYGAEPVFITMPVNPAFQKPKDPYQAAVMQAVLRNNVVMTEVANQAGAPLVPLYEALREPQLFLDAVHVNGAGMARKAKVISAALAQVLAAPEVP
jgi:lysophospholipase L1-like esterase